MVGLTQHPVVTDTVETSGEEALETCCRVAQGVERPLLAGHERAETKVTVTVRGENAAETVEGVGHRRDERAAMLGPGFTDEQSPQFVTDVVDRFTGPTNRNRVARQAA